MAGLRIGIVGGGMIGKKHLEVLLKERGYEVAGIADPAPAAEALAKEINAPYFKDYEKLLDAKPDGVVVATPNQLHVRVGLACVARGIPALVEKPIADSVAEGLKLVQAADKANVPILTGHHRRHHPILAKAAETIQSGAIGRVTAVVAMYLNHKPDSYYELTWRREPGGGPVLINSIHDIDCLRFLCGELDSVQASTANGVRNFEVEDTAAAVLRFKSGALGTIIISDTVSTPWSWEMGSYENPVWPHESQNCYMITGTRGSLAIPSLDLWWHEPGQGWTDALTRRRVQYVPADCYVQQMKNFAAVIRQEAKPVVSGWDGVRTLATTLAITESGRTGKPVRVEDMLAA